MEYRQLGPSGIKVSVLSVGAWLTFGSSLDRDTAAQVMSLAFEAGVNFFDNAEEYGKGLSESLMGKVLRDLGWPRHSYLISTKFFWGIHEGPNTTNTLNRKYLLAAIDASLERLGLDHVDIVYCHRYDPSTPLEETVWAMSDLISHGKAHYWGTSKWPAPAIKEARAIADRHHLHKPIVEQPEYSLIRRHRVEVEYASMFAEMELGLTTHSPLEKGLLTGKYVGGGIAGTRAELVPRLSAELTDRDMNAVVATFAEIARSLDCTPAQLALAWTMGNPHVASVICGASTPTQLLENLEAVELVNHIDDDARARIQDLFLSVSDIGG